MERLRLAVKKDGALQFLSHLGVSIIDRKEGDDHGKTTFSC